VFAWLLLLLLIVLAFSDQCVEQASGFGDDYDSGAPRKPVTYEAVDLDTGHEALEISKQIISMGGSALAELEDQARM
jgi:hypothetical protein